MIVVMMGVSGSGKTTVGCALAARLGLPFEEDDDLHPPANVAKMRAGIPLDDADRAPWLDAIADWIAANGERGGVVSCSALRRRYRDRVRAAGNDALRFVMLDIDAPHARNRIVTRGAHFMPASLIGSQIDTLERPLGEADVLVLSATQPVDSLVQAIRDWIARPLPVRLPSARTGGTTSG